MADISVLILVLASLSEHFYEIICLYLPVIQPFRFFRNCQSGFLCYAILKMIIIIKLSLLTFQADLLWG